MRGGEAAYQGYRLFPLLYATHTKCDNIRTEIASGYAARNRVNERFALLTRFLLLGPLLLAVSGCFQAGAARDDAVTAASASRYPACEAEFKAFVALAKLAKQAGDNWRVYEPALDALQDQILDCVDDNYPDPLPI